MSIKIVNLLNRSWVAFPLMIFIFVLFMMLGFKCESWQEHHVTLATLISHKGSL
jgi:hypothetical protein